VIARYHVADVFDPRQNIEAGTQYLKELLDRYGQNLSLALAAYNAGPDRVVEYGGVPPFAETVAYVRRVTQRYSQFQTKQQ
jgi:soluble lytic murein transglycosylase-like protein